MVLSIDEKSQIQALDRTQPGLPIKPGRCGTMTHDYKRNGTTTLFAALDMLDGKVIGRCMQRHCNQEFIRFLNAMVWRGRCAEARPFHCDSGLARMMAKEVSLAAAIAMAKKRPSNRRATRSGAYRGLTVGGRAS